MFIKDGVEIKDVVYNGNRGAAIWVQNGGSLDMQGGKISGCEADYGAAISVEGAGSAFTMSGGEISGNTAVRSYGGAVNVDYGAEFTMSGGTISGNTAATYGGAVNVGWGSAFTMSGGEISGNTASDSGGAVYLLSDRSSAGDSVFTMSGGEISGNTASFGYGGGVCLSSDSGYYSTFTMSGGEISGNTASRGYGGGVFVYESIFAKRGGTITDDNRPNAAYSLIGSKTRTTTAGPGVRLYVDVTPAGNFIDPLDNVDTTGNWL